MLHVKYYKENKLTYLSTTKKNRNRQRKVLILMYSSSKKKKKSNTPIYFNTNYRREMKLVPIIMVYFSFML